MNLIEFPQKVYRPVWINGKRDNLGDVVICRGSERKGKIIGFAPLGTKKILIRWEDNKNQLICRENILNKSLSG